MSSFFLTLTLLSTLALLACSSLYDIGEDLTPQEQEQLAAVQASAAEDFLAAVRSGRGRREDDAPFRLCGSKLLQFIMDRDLCRPDKCEGVVKRSGAEEGAAVFQSRARRGADTAAITRLCCTNVCRPSQIRKICCE